MALTNKNRATNLGSLLAKAQWCSTRKEDEALKRHNYVNELSRVEEIWPWLSEKYGEVLAVDAPHVTHPEKFSYSELNNQISIASAGFNNNVGL